MAFTVYAYKVERNSDRTAPLAGLLDQCYARQLSQRAIRVGADTFRLEELNRADNLLYLDFVRLRQEHGPGRAHPSRQITGFQFQPGETFGEETAALFDPATCNLLLQFNFAGARAGHLQEYFSNINNNADDIYDLLPRFDEHVEARLRHKRIIKNLRFKMPVSHIRGADRAAGVPLIDVLNVSQQYGAEQLEITLSAGRRRSSSLDMNGFNRALAWLHRRIDHDQNAVTALTVGAKGNIDEETEILNLLGHRLKQVYDDLPIGEDKRCERSVRWEALHRAYDAWQRQLGN